jgi:hypothetical protein
MYFGVWGWIYGVTVSGAACCSCSWRVIPDVCLRLRCEACAVNFVNRFDIRFFFILFGHVFRGIFPRQPVQHNRCVDDTRRKLPHSACTLWYMHNIIFIYVYNTRMCFTMKASRRITRGPGIWLQPGSLWHLPQTHKLGVGMHCYAFSVCNQANTYAKLMVCTQGRHGQGVWPRSGAERFRLQSAV